MVKGKSNFEFAAMRSGQSPEDLAILEAEWSEWTVTDESPMTFEPLPDDLRTASSHARLDARQRRRHSKRRFLIESGDDVV